MSIEEFYDSYIEELSDTIKGFGTGSMPHFARVVDLMGDKSLSMLKEKGFSYPILVLEEFDDSESMQDGELRELELRGSFSVLYHISDDDGVADQRARIRDARALGRKVFSKMLLDAIPRSGNTLYDNSVDVGFRRDGHYVYQVAGTLSGFKIDFTWIASGNLVQFSPATDLNS